MTGELSKQSTVPTCGTVTLDGPPTQHVGRMKELAASGETAMTQLQILCTHHVAIICADYERSKRFYTRFLGLEVVAEVQPDGTQIELFSFPNPPKRPSYPEACGLRHIAFEVADVDAAVAHLKVHGVVAEPVRVDEFTGKRFTFFADPDGLPLELYER